jgi:hypothetical protein
LLESFCVGENFLGQKKTKKQEKHVPLLTEGNLRYDPSVTVGSKDEQAI